MFADNYTARYYRLLFKIKQFISRLDMDIFVFFICTIRQLMNQKLNTPHFDKILMWLYDKSYENNELRIPLLTEQEPILFNVGKKRRLYSYRKINPQQIQSLI